jgi:hypothetical protein
LEKSYSVEATAKVKKLFAVSGVDWDVTVGSVVVGSKVGTWDGDKDDDAAEGLSVGV